jgi:hypothetical protein
MRIHRLPAALAFASIVLPAAALAQFGEKWRTTHAVSYSIYDIADFDGNGALDFLTGENRDASGEFIGVRLTSTGALLAQTATRYEHQNLFATDLDGDGPREILFFDPATGRQRCFSFSGPPGPLVLRWAIRPFGISDPSQMYFVDLDGNGQLYIVFQSSSSEQFEIYTRTGTLFGTFDANQQHGAIFEALLNQDFDGDGREEILLIYREYSGAPYQSLIMLESTAPVGVEPGPESLRAVRLGASVPNPAAGTARIDYTVPARGPVSLRLLDVSGREVRTLVAGEVAAGRHEVLWDGRDARGRAMPAGAYFYELTANGQRQARRLVRLN